MYDVLDEPLIRAQVDGTASVGTLPEVFAWLSGKHVVHFSGLQPHQHHPWHSFLTQLAAIALSRSGTSKPPKKSEVWRSLLLALSGNDPQAWNLVVSDLAAPALLQPPVPEGTLKGFKNTYRTPDALDILVTQRNFDVKRERIQEPELDHWLYALVVLQTFEGYSGRDTYGIARMNGGSSNRPCVAIAPSLSWSARFCRDVDVWLEEREGLISRLSYDPKGHALLWLRPWDGLESLPRPSLDPFFIESCRRLRLITRGDAIEGVATTSKVSRVDMSNHSGDTGDIWTPTQLSSKKGGLTSLTVPASGFNYRKLADILFGEKWNPPAAQQLHPEDGSTPIIIAQALVRGQGKTEGYHHRVVMIPAKAKRFFGKKDEKSLQSRSQEMIKRASEIQRWVKQAILVLFQGVQATKLDLRDGSADTWIARLDTRIDDRFFGVLFGQITESDMPARLAWDETLDDIAQQTFGEAIDEAPLPSAQRYPLTAAATSRFRSARKRIMAELIDHRSAKNTAQPSHPSDDHLPTGD